MKNRNNQLTATLFVVALALAPVVQAVPSSDEGSIGLRANEGPRATPTPRPRPTPAPRAGAPVALAANEGISANSEANSAYATSPEPQNLPAITIHSTGNVIRGETGSFVLNMKPALAFGGMYVNFSVGGTAINGVDYVKLVSPAYIGPSGYGVILVQTLADPRASFTRQAYSVVVTLEAGAGYAVGSPRSATMWIKP